MTKLERFIRTHYRMKLTCATRGVYFQGESLNQLDFIRIGIFKLFRISMISILYKFLNNKIVYFHKILIPFRYLDTTKRIILHFQGISTLNIKHLERLQSWSSKMPYITFLHNRPIVGIHQLETCFKAYLKASHNVPYLQALVKYCFKAL